MQAIISYLTPFKGILALPVGLFSTVFRQKCYQYAILLVAIASKIFIKSPKMINLLTL